MVKTNKIVLLIIFFGFILSVLLSLNNLNKYDKNNIGASGSSYHQMIKYDAYRYLSHGDNIKNQLKNEVNFFKTGSESYTKYLPARIAAAYYYFFNVDLFENSYDKKIKTGVHLPYLIIQCFFYFFCLTLLYLTLSKIFKEKICFIIIFFLCFEPTIFQYHGTFWSESYFFSLQILLISLILKPNSKIGTFFFIGFFLGILSLQKEYAIFYIIPVIIYFLIYLKEKKIKNILTLIFGFFIVQSFLGFNNYYRSGVFYIMPATTKTDLHMLLVTSVMSKEYNMNTTEFESFESKATLEWINKNSIEYKKNYELLPDSSKEPSFMNYRSYIANESDRVKFDLFIISRTFGYFRDYPINFLTEVIKKSIHILLLNPFHIYSDHKYKSGEVYYLTREHDKLIPYRIIYTLIVYLICLLGLFYMIKRKEYKILIYSVLSILYFYVPVSWHGNTRYFVPSLIYFSIFFASGTDKLIHFIKNK